jgi:hypothetical protein
MVFHKNDITKKEYSIKKKHHGKPNIFPIEIFVKDYELLS